MGFVDSAKFRGAELIHLPVHQDERGNLGVFEWEQEADFKVRRVFFVNVHDEKVVRAEHATDGIEVIFAASGGVTADLDNGHEVTTIRLDGNRVGLKVESGVWRCLRDFLPQTTLVVLADKTYANTTQYAEPQPHLVQRLSECTPT